MANAVTAIGLVSGGLDSALAVAIVRRQGIAVVGLNVSIGFSADYLRHASSGGNLEEYIAETSRRMSASFGVPVRVVDAFEEYREVLLAPRHGYGANVNPCIDCHAFMLRIAKDLLPREGALFVFTGEVLGQRPMSQTMPSLRLVERLSGLEGLLVRPLSARLLPETRAEREGWIDRERLLDIQGRSRKRQLELASELGLAGYSSPAGGCTLTDENYARKMKDLWAHQPSRGLTRDEAVLLAVGRHFRLSPAVKAVVGRREAENLYLERFGGGAWLACAVGAPGATVLVQGEPSEGDLMLAASLAARYSDAKALPAVSVRLRRGGEERVVETAPLGADELDALRISL